ncbi:putative glycoside hydrolase [Burkholderia sp. JP2-270]|nr:putative glycoside hydrolase [Burkholderia sp. JP2-270]
MRDVHATGAADIRAQLDTADAAGTKEWMPWNTLDRYDPAVPPR